MKELQASNNRIVSERDGSRLELHAVKDALKSLRINSDVWQCERNLARLYLERERMERGADRSAAEVRRILCCECTSLTHGQDAKRKLQEVCDALECSSCLHLCKEMHTCVCVIFISADILIEIDLDCPVDTRTALNAL